MGVAIMIYHGIEELIGNTPLVELKRTRERFDLKAGIYMKMESYNPAGSAKDRIALRIIRSLEQSGKLKKGGTIIESTSGNTGIALAAIGHSRGYRVILVMPENMSGERIALMKGLGAEIVLTSAEGFMTEAKGKAIELEASIPGSVRIGQGSNDENPLAHFETTGPEIWEALEGKVDIFVSAIGTGGTITGTGRFLKQQDPDIRIAGIEPAASPILNGGKPGPHKIQGIGPTAPSAVLDTSIYDEIIDVTDEDAVRYARELAFSEGLFGGMSTGAALCGVLELASRPENHGLNIVFISTDSGERYISSGLYS